MFPRETNSAIIIEHVPTNYSLRPTIAPMIDIDVSTIPDYLALLISGASTNAGIRSHLVVKPLLLYLARCADSIKIARALLARMMRPLVIQRQICHSSR